MLAELSYNCSRDAGRRLYMDWPLMRTPWSEGDSRRSRVTMIALDEIYGHAPVSRRSCPDPTEVDRG